MDEKQIPCDLWKVEVRNKRWIVGNATFQHEITALHYCLDCISFFSSRRKHVSAFVTGPDARYEYHG